MLKTLPWVVIILLLIPFEFLYSDFNEGFEDGFNQWIWDYDIDWDIASPAIEGSSCAECNGHGANDLNAAMTLELLYRGSGYMSFWYSTSTESGGDYLEFWINDDLQESWSGINGWTEVTFFIPHGFNTLKWIYNKNGTVTANDDTVYVDDIHGWFACSADAGSTQQVPEGALVTLDGSASIATLFNWTQIDDGPSVTLYDRNTVSPYFTAPTGLSSETVLVFRLSVDGGLKEATVSVFVGASPYVHAGQDQEVTEGDVVSLNGSASYDRNGGILTYSWDQLSGISVSLSGADTATASFTAPDISPAFYEDLVFELSVTNGYSITKTDTVTVKVYDTDCPRAEVGTDVNGMMGGLITLDGTASYDPNDPSGALLSYSWTQDASDTVTVTLSGDTTATPSFIPPENVGEYVLHFTLYISHPTNGNDADTAAVYVTTPPIANAGEDFSATENDIVTLDGTGSFEVDGDVFTYAWVQTGGSGVTLNGAAAAQPSFPVPPVSSTDVLTFQLLVDDGKGGTDTDTVNVKIYDSDHPHAQAGTDLNVTENQAGCMLDGSQSNDPQGDTLTFLWDQVDSSGYSVTLLDVDVASPVFTAPDISDENSIVELDFELTVTDISANADTDTVKVKVYGSGNPVANAGEDFSIEEGSTVNLEGSVSADPNGDPISFSWTKISGPPVDLSGVDMNSPSPSFFIGSIPVDIVLEFELTVTDTVNDGTDTDTVKVFITKTTNGSDRESNNAFGCGKGSGGHYPMIIFMIMGLALVIIKKHFKQLFSVHPQ